jgi:protoporphyrinogen oxidase
MTKRILICGAGVAGLIAALTLTRRGKSDITVVERAPEAGGLLKTFDYGPGLQFDCGMHFWTETGINKLDSDIRALLPDADWVQLRNEKRDLSGLYYQDRIQLNSQYPDLRNLPAEDYRACLADFFSHINTNGAAAAQPAASFADYVARRFGPEIAKHLCAIAEKVHGFDAAQLHEMARSLPLLDRVVLFDETPFKDLMASEALRTRLAYPEQRNLPQKFASGFSSFYPAEYGIGRVIAALVELLKARGVKMITNAAVERFDIQDGHVRAAQIGGSDFAGSIENIDTVIWANSGIALAPLLQIDAKSYGMDQPRRTVLVNLLLNEKPNLGDLYCLFCAAPGMATYRVTNYAGYCPAADRGGKFPISTELIVDPAGVRDPEALRRRALDELRAMKIIDKEPAFSAVEVLPGGFPTLSLRSIAGFEAIRQRIKAEGPKNIAMVGILSEPKLFFQNEIMRDVHRKFSDA